MDIIKQKSHELYVAKFIKEWANKWLDKRWKVNIPGYVSDSVLSDIYVNFYYDVSSGNMKVEEKKLVLVFLMFVFIQYDLPKVSFSCLRIDEVLTTVKCQLAQRTRTTLLGTK
ncbi:hypothetical protein Hamer_G010860 [Homarus americanus]|uniref:Uncharacterized protein n=1 Tax=Homarus americanus TaxID=6706 RepID=A0A8J5JUP9_HOMAM|nr:hypothetical protein Hamer_G010860 [Homarus americanus]